MKREYHAVIEGKPDLSKYLTLIYYSLDVIGAINYHEMRWGSVLKRRTTLICVTLMEIFFVDQ